MKLRNATLAVAIATAMFAAPVFADDAHHPESTQGAARKAPDKTVKSMQDNVAKMKRQLNAIARAKTDEERNKLLAEHMMTMHENMMMARGMMGGEMNCPMMKDGMMGGGMGPGGKPGNADERMDRMEKRMDMMQMMMDRMTKPRAGGEDAPGTGDH